MNPADKPDKPRLPRPRSQSDVDPTEPRRERQGTTDPRRESIHYTYREAFGSSRRRY